MNTVFGPRLTLLAMLLFVVACSENGGMENGNNDPGNGGSGSCERSDNRSAETATDLETGESIRGYICPVGQRDWYQFRLDESAIIEIRAGMTTGLTPVELTYTVYAANDNGTAGQTVARARLEDVGRPYPLEALECLAPGDYFIEVRDFRDNNQDFNHPYELTLTTHADPDANEPNNSREQARPLSEGETVEGYIACHGDEDWFSIEVADRELVQILVTSDVADYQLRVELRNAAGTVIAHEESSTGMSEATDISRMVVPDGAGTYYLVVKDASGERADLTTPYQLTVNLFEDIDPNEPNNRASEATDLSASPVSCGGSWTQVTSWGTIAAPGDYDWFRLPIQGCENGLIEVEMVFATEGLSDQEKWVLSQELQADLMLIRPHEETTCSEDADCALLDRQCNNDLDCAGFNEQCNGGRCSGARACLKENVCGGVQVQRRYDCPPFLEHCNQANAQRPQKNRAFISAPLFGGEAVYIRAADFQSQASQPQLRYDLRVRVRANPDSNEPNNLFMNNPDRDLPIRQNQELATPIEVLDCTGPEPECCNSGTWTTGSLGYQSDMDWFSYEHPCLGQDCTLAFHFETDAGPVDFVMNLYRQRTLWQTMVANDVASHHPARAGIVGGLSPDNRCYYASVLHDEEDFTYYLQVRDRQLLHDNGLTVIESSRAWDPNQQYRFCIEKVSNICEEPPCHLYDNGCGHP